MVRVPKFFRHIFGVNAESCWKANVQHRHTSRAVICLFSPNAPTFEQFKTHVFETVLEELAKAINKHGCGFSGDATEVEESGEEIGVDEVIGLGFYRIRYRVDDIDVKTDDTRYRPFWKW